MGRFLLYLFVLYIIFFLLKYISIQIPIIKQTFFVIFTLWTLACIKYIFKYERVAVTCTQFLVHSLCEFHSVCASAVLLEVSRRRYSFRRIWPGLNCPANYMVDDDYNHPATALSYHGHRPMTRTRFHLNTRL